MVSAISQVKAEVQSAVEECARRHGWPAPAGVAGDVMRPRSSDHGDFSSNAAMTWAARLRKEGVNLPPREVAEQLLACWPGESFLQSRDIAGPGFINVTVDTDWYKERASDIVARPDAVGRLDVGQGASWQVEFVSANPTGPLHFGGARNAVLGDALARILEAAGYRVQREFYVNDAGAQFDLFVRSLYAFYMRLQDLDAELPEEGYAGAYMEDYAREVARSEADVLTPLPAADAHALLRPLALNIVLTDVREELRLIDVEFDRWYREQELYDSGAVQSAIEELGRMGATYERDGALWFAASRFPGMDQDIVLVRGTGAPTYFAADIAYHREKLQERGFDRAVDVWSVDHQGHVPRMKAVLQALELDPDSLTILLYDLVKLVRDGVEVTMSKRGGQFLTLREVVAEVGPDAVRFLLLTRAPESVLEFDLEDAKARHQDNPVFFVQYSHARLCSIRRRAREAGLEIPTEEGQSSDLMRARLGHDSEMALIKTLLSLDEEIEAAVHRLSPHSLTYYAVRIASAVNGFYRDCRVLDLEQRELSAARLLLCEAARIVLARVLSLLGVQAPATM